MNPDEQLDALLRAARDDAPDTARADYAFETRLAARLRAERNESWFAWAWRLSPFFAALAVATAVWCHATLELAPDPGYVLDVRHDDAQSAVLALLAREVR
jgi:hypothetical protein